MYEYIIEEQMETLINKLKNNQMSNEESNNFVNDYELEDEFSHDTIREIQYNFTEQAKEYLKENHPSKYVIFQDWCVHICTVEFAKKNLKSSRYKVC